MRIAIVAPSAVPFAIGGAERLWDGLLGHLNADTPHDAELIKLPSREHSLPDLVNTYRAFFELDLSHFDLVISGKYPAWMVQHPRHVVYMLHPLRGLYDQYPPDAPHRYPAGHTAALPLTSYLRAHDPRGACSVTEVFERFASVHATNPADGDFAFPGPLARELVQWLDAYALDPSRIVRHAAISATVARRTEYFPQGVPVEVVIPPSGLTGLREGEARFFFAASRLDRPKRVDLLVEAMQTATHDLPLKIAGSGPDEDRLRALSAGDPRIELLGRVTDDELAELYSNSASVLFVPADEDLGLITLEAQSCAKPVITCIDSGGPTELVTDGVSGYVVEPRAEAIAGAMDLIASDPARAVEMGRAGRARSATISWSAVADVLLRPPSTSVTSDAVRARRPKVVVLSTFPIWPPIGGGALRCLHLSRGLSQVADVRVVCFGAGGARGVRMISPGLSQHIVARTPMHHQMEAALGMGVKIPVTDITDGVLFDQSPEFVVACREALAEADAVILEHPYLLRAALQCAPDLPIIYDAQNAEYVMKADLLDAGPAGDRLRRLARELEQQAVRRATLVTACTDADIDLLRVLGPTLAEFVVVPNGTDLETTPFTGADERAVRRQRWIAALHAGGGPAVTRVALFIGSYHPPNSAAAEAIVRFAGQLPEVMFVLAGSHTRHFARWKLPVNVLLLDHISDTHRLELLAMADVALNPMLSGGGSNLKLAEYFAAGVPAVSTPVGSRGLGASDGVHLVLAEVGDMPAAIRRVLDDPELASQHAEAARALVETAFDWHTLARAYAGHVRRAAGSERNRLAR